MSVERQSWLDRLLCRIGYRLQVVGDWLYDAHMESDDEE